MRRERGRIPGATSGAPLLPGKASLSLRPTVGSFHWRNEGQGQPTVASEVPAEELVYLAAAGPGAYKGGRRALTAVSGREKANESGGGGVLGVLAGAKG